MVREHQQRQNSDGRMKAQRNGKRRGGSAIHMTLY
jgi:hypothetical protein